MLAYNWGPNGHPIQIGSTPVGVAGSPTNLAFETLHWEGDQLLFTTNSSGQLDDIKVGSIGDITPLDPTYKGLTFYDRDFSGSVGFCHNATGAAGSGRTNPYVRSSKLGSLPTSPCTVTGRSQTMAVSGSIAWWSGEGMSVPGGRWATNGNAQVGHGTLIGMPRADGITDGFNAVQGVRSYDPTLGSWTTPDGYSGIISAPASQKSYIWNNDDAVGYSDPSGFAAMWGNPTGSGCDTVFCSNDSEQIADDAASTNTVFVDRTVQGILTDIAALGTLDTFARDIIQKAIRAAANSGIEAGGWIYETNGIPSLGPAFTPTTVIDSYGRAHPGLIDAPTAKSGTNKDGSKWQLVAWWHIHPPGVDDEGTPKDEGSLNGKFFSANDIATSQACGCIGYVGTSDDHLERLDPRDSSEAPVGKGWVF